jgi:hypothetical protein
METIGAIFKTLARGFMVFAGLPVLFLVGKIALSTEAAHKAIADSLPGAIDNVLITQGIFLVLASMGLFVLVDIMIAIRRLCELSEYQASLMEKQQSRVQPPVPTKGRAA